MHVHWWTPDEFLSNFDRPVPIRQIFSNSLFDLFLIFEKVLSEEIFEIAKLLPF